MSLQEIEQELPKLTPEEREHLRQTLNALRQPTKVVATPEMLAERRRLLDETMRGEWTAELAGFEETQAKDREKNDELHRRWRD